jgi:peroxiredoxin
MTPALAAVGDPAPTPSLIDLGGRRFPVSDRWREHPLVLSFLRYFGCPFCQAWVGTLAARADAFDAAGVRVVVVGQGTAGQAKAFTGPRRLPFEVAVDPDRWAYQAFGLVDGGQVELLHPAAAAKWVGVQLRGEGRQGGLQGGSLRQMPGTFVVDTAGVLRFVHRNRHQADDPAVAAVLEVCAGLRT